MSSELSKSEGHDVKLWAGFDLTTAQKFANQQAAAAGQAYPFPTREEETQAVPDDQLSEGQKAHRAMLAERQAIDAANPEVAQQRMLGGIGTGAAFTEITGLSSSWGGSDGTAIYAG